MRYNGFITNILKYGDAVEICDKVYCVEDCYLDGMRGNDDMFTTLGLDKMAFAKDCYGYAPIGGSGSGGFPEARHGDYEGLTRLINALYALAQKLQIQINGIWMNKTQIDAKIAEIEADIKLYNEILARIKK